MQAERNVDITLVFPDLKVSSGTNSYVTNIFTGFDALGVKYRSIGIRKHEISLRGKPYFGFISQLLNSKVRFANTRIVHALSPGAIIKGTNIVTIHDIIPLIKKEQYLKTWQERLSFNLSTGKALSVPTLVLTSEVVRRQMVETLNIDPDRLKVIPLSINDRDFFPSENPVAFRKDKINVVMVSDFNPRKRVDLAIRALRDDPEIEFFHIGPVNSWKNRFQHAKELAGSSKNIHILGPKTVEQLRNYISGSDMFLFLSEIEGFGLPPIEAMACGTNVIVSDIDIFHETLKDFATFVSLENFSADTVRYAIKRRKSREELLNYAKKYSIGSHVESLLKVYQAVT